MQPTNDTQSLMGVSLASFFVPFLAAPSPADAEAVESRLEAGSTRHDTSINLCLLMRAPVPVRSTDTWLPREIGPPLRFGVGRLATTTCLALHSADGSVLYVVHRPA